MESHRISLQIREVTSVSVTFILRIAFVTRNSAIALSDDEEEPFRAPTISEALGRGLAVKVNANNWKRVVVQVDEDEQEAIVIVYGLLPRKKYEINLNIAASDENISESVTTLATHTVTPSTSLQADTTVNAPDTPDMVVPPTLTPPTTPIRSSPPKAVTEDHITQLRKQLTLVNAERDELISYLKVARRESQRTETILKSEIETLKRASEKHASSEHRSRQKVLALQEAVKQTNAAAGDLEDEIKNVEDTLPALGERARTAQLSYERVKYEVEQTCSELNVAMNSDNQIIQELHGDLTNVCAKLEKVDAKREKLEKDVIPHLEEKLLEIRREIAEERTLLSEDYQHDAADDITGIWNVRNWMSPIQRPALQRYCP